MATVVPNTCPTWLFRELRGWGFAGAQNKRPPCKCCLETFPSGDPQWLWWSILKRSLYWLGVSWIAKIAEMPRIRLFRTNRRVRSSRPSSVDANSSVSLRLISDMRELWRRSSTYISRGRWKLSWTFLNPTAQEAMLRFRTGDHSVGLTMSWHVSPVPVLNDVLIVIGWGAIRMCALHGLNIPNHAKQQKKLS